MKYNKKLLFVSHDASRTGAPIVLKSHLKYLKIAYPKFDFDILLKSGGTIEDEFKEISNVITLSNYSSRSSRILEKFLKKLDKNYSGYNNRLRKKIENKYKLIYGNTVVTTDILVLAKKMCPDVITVSHIHELDYAIKLFFGAASFEKSIPYIDYFVAASLSVSNILTNTYNIPKSKIFLHYEHIPLVSGGISSNEPNMISNKTGLKICGSGTLEWRKGIDIFIQSAYLLNCSKPNSDFHFYWIGGNKDSIGYEKAMSDINKLNIEHRITIIESCNNPLSYMKECDLFLLTSREDPFPLVCLEAASLAKPIICFKKSGGMEEFVDDSIGWVIDYLDTNKLNELFVNFLNDPNYKELIQKKGTEAKSKVQNYSIDKGVEKLKFILDNILQLGINN